MNRVVFCEIEINGEKKKFPLLFSLGVLDKIKEHGDIKSVMDSMKDLRDMSAFLDLVAAMSDAGSKRMKRYEEKDFPTIEREDLELLGFRDALAIRDKIYEAIAAGFENEVEGKSNAKKKDGK